MYLSKQWRESRIVTILAILGLAILLALVIKAGIAVDAARLHVENGNQRGAWDVAFTSLLYFEAILISFWGWLIAGIGVGKNLGEDGGSFLFTRPRRRAWFLWSDWGYAMAQIAAIIVLANLMIGFLLARILHLMHGPAAVPITYGGPLVPILPVMVLVSVGVLLCAGLIYGLTYFCTIVVKRSIGVMLGAGIFVLYEIFQGLILHYYPTVHFPNLVLDLFNFHHGFHGFSPNLTVNIIVRAAVMMAFPIAAQLILDRSEV